MVLWRLKSGTLFATLALSGMLSASAQESFLDEFRAVNYAKAEQSSVRRPVFLSSADAESDLDDDDIGGNDIVEPSDFDRSVVGGISDDYESVNGSKTHSASLEVDEICAEEDCKSPADCDVPLVRFRKTCYQGTQLNYGYVHDDVSTGLAIRTVDTYGTFAIPIEGMDHFVTLSPFFRADMLDAAAALDVPSTLYETGVKAFWRRPIDDRFSTIVLVTPSVRSDFQTSQGAFRLFGLALLTWQAIPDTLAFSGGAVYTGRQDYPVLPAMGLLWTPSPLWKFDIQFPSPRISYRIAKNGAATETWSYLSGVFGGNTWAVTRANGTNDELTLRDLRLVSGIEHLLAGNRGIFIECGYVFSRSLEYNNVPLTRELDASWMLRTGITF